MAGRITYPLGILLVVSIACSTAIASGGDPLELVTANEDGVSLRLAQVDPVIAPVMTEAGAFTAIEIAEYGFTDQVGAPRLPVMRRLIEVPIGAGWEITTSIYQTREQVLSDPILPLQPSRPKTDDPPPPFAYDGAAYAQAGFANLPVVSVEEIGRLRGHRLVQLIVRPVDYDPVAGQLRILESAEFRIDFTNADLAATNAQHARYRSEPYDRMIRAAALNGEALRYKPIGEIGYLVISDPAFTADVDLQAMLDWKAARGFHVTHVSTDLTGPTKEAIKAYIQDAYDNWAIPPTFVLLIGDSPAIPHWTGSGTGSPATDLNYMMLAGSDYLPDICLGRFSATNPTHLHNMVAKTLSFERVEWTGNDEWEKYATFMASCDNYTVSEGTHNYVINTYLLPLGYQVDRLYCQTYNATTQQVIDAVNEGRSQLTYSGHGSETSWADGPPFSQSNVNNLVNSVYPWVQSYACVTGYFPRTECFGETWIRAASGGVAFWGSSVNSYWTEDDILEKRLYEGWFDDQYPADIVNQTWIGGMTNYAKLRYIDYFGDSGMTRRYFEMYNVLGDASVDVWTDVPQAANVNAPETLLAGQLTFDLTVTGVPYAMVSVQKEDGGNDLFLTAWTDPLGNATVDLPEPLTPGTLTLAITAHDLEPTIVPIQVIQPSGPYLIFESYAIDDAHWDDDGQIDAGEDVGLDITLENIGIDDATDVSMVLGWDDPYVGGPTVEMTLPDIPAGGFGTTNQPFPIGVSGAAPDQHVITFDFGAHSNEGEWQGEFDVTVQAPVLTSGAVLIDDSAPGGDGDGVADPGETFYVQLWLGNTGHSDCGPVTGTLSCTHPAVQIPDDEASCFGVEIGEGGLLSAFQVELNPSCPSPEQLTFQVGLAGYSEFAASVQFEISVGAFFDDVETDLGWSLAAADDDAASGRWERVDPIGTEYNAQPCQPEDDHTADPAALCFVTANGTVGGAAGEADVDGGKTTLLSPVFDLSDAVSATIEYWRWYTNDLGNNPDEDYWDVDVTANGVNWVSLEHTNVSANSWTQHTFNLTEHILLTDQVQIRFIASDEINGSLVEAGVDDFTLEAVRTPATDVAVEEIAASFGLVSCRPNPFNPRTAIVYRVGNATHAQLAIFDVSGRVVRTLVDRSVQAGEHTVVFDGLDDSGRAVSTGIYFLRMETPEYLSIRQVTLLK